MRYLNGSILIEFNLCINGNILSKNLKKFLNRIDKE